MDSVGLELDGSRKAEQLTDLGFSRAASGAGLSPLDLQKYEEWKTTERRSAGFPPVVEGRA